MSWSLGLEQEQLERVESGAPCCVKHCALPGEWVFVCKKCRLRFAPWCSPHAAAEEADLPGLSEVGCPDCWAFVPGSAWRSLFDLVPAAS